MIQEFFLNSNQINHLNSYRRFHQHFHISIIFISGSLFNEMWFTDQNYQSLCIEN